MDKRLQNYAEWYYTKYFPSRNMLREKLFQKCQDWEIVDDVLQKIQPMIVEEQNIESRVHAYVSQGKTKQYISQKLLQKKFDKQLLERVLLKESETLDDPENYRSQIQEEIRKWQRKLISKKMLTYTLSMKYSIAKQLIHELLQEYDDRDILALILLSDKSTKQKAKSTNDGIEKLVTKLAQKGFQISDIYAALRWR